MADQDFQSQPTQEQNPLVPRGQQPSLIIPKSQPLPNADPKVKLLKKLGLIVGLLLILSFILPIFLTRSHPTASRLPQPTIPASPPTPFVTISNPTSLGQYQNFFDQIENDIKNSSLEFPPPQYDPEIKP